MFAGKTLLITGGVGSFGHAVLNRFLETDVREIRVFSRDEKKQEDMRRRLNCRKVRFYIGDIRNYESIEAAVRGVDYVFHAAALKQVPSCEFHPMEAIRTNVLGTENVLNATIANQVKKVIFLSTDKAVYPINTMGMTKALMEKLMVAKSRFTDPEKTILCCTRYGNVMGSRGSVIPLFIEQIKAGKPLTITDPAMTRFLMSLDDAVDLVLYAYTHARQGDILVKKAPASRVDDLALALQKIFEVKPDVRIIGARHGEKVHETLLTRAEMARAEVGEDFFRIVDDSSDLNNKKYYDEGDHTVALMDDYTSCNTRRLNVPEIMDMLLQLDFIQRELRDKPR